MSDLLKSQLPNTPTVTIGVCVRNCETLVGDAIESIVSQDFPHSLMQVIFVDDGSTDGTLTVIQNYIQKLDIITEVVHQRWKGLGAARNVVVDNADGKYIIWVDGDMLLSRQFVGKQVQFMEDNPEVAVAKGSYGMYKTNLVGILENMEFMTANSRRMRSVDLAPLGTGGSIYRVDAIREIGGFDRSIKGSGEDADAERRIRARKWLLDTTPAVFYERRRKSWRSLWDEYYWHGKGGSQALRKNVWLTNPYKLFPPFALVVESMRVVIGYKLVRKKIVLLLPIHYMFKRTAWLLGFMRNLVSH